MPEAQPGPVPLEKAMSGVLGLLAAGRDETAGGDRRPTEAVLFDAGLSLNEIAQVTGRKYESVKTTIRRHRERRAKAEAAD